jgi:hypothetical protein
LKHGGTEATEENKIEGILGCEAAKILMNSNTEEQRIRGGKKIGVVRRDKNRRGLVKILIDQGA